MKDPNTNVQICSLITGVLIPLLVAALAKAHASSSVKAVLNLGLSAIAGTVGTLLLQSHANWQAWLLSVAMTWGTSIVSYYGLHKPTGTAPAVSSATSSVGIG